MALPVNTVFVDQVTVIGQPWIQGSNDWINGAYGVLGATYTPTAFRTALGSTTVGDAVFIAASAAAARTAIGAASSAAGATGLTLISRQVAVSSASIDFTSIASSTYDSYLLVCDNVYPATNATTLRLQFSLGGVFQTTALYTHNHFRFTAAGSGVDGSISDTSACICSSAETLGTGTNQVFSGDVTISNCAQTIQEKRWKSHSTYVASTANNIVDVGGGRFTTTSAIDGFRLFMSAGNIAFGTFTLYGLQKA